MSENYGTKVNDVSVNYVKRNLLRRNGTNTVTGSLNTKNNEIVNFQDPENNQDTATNPDMDTTDNIVGKI